MLNKFGKREKKNTLDKFYTKKNVAKDLVGSVFKRYQVDDFDVILEPSAGAGSFLFHLPESKRLGLDISPADAEIEKADFFDWKADKDKNYLVIGNPPFGRVSSLAVRFFNQSAEFADVIAFLVPRTFRRISVHNKLNLNFHLLHDEEIPTRPCAFEPQMGVKCCFQIWERRKEKRNKIILPKECSTWAYLPLGPKDENGQPTPPKGASFAIKAYGSNCGQVVVDNLDSLRPKSWHWIKCDNPEELILKFSKLDYSISENTARQNSLGRGELIMLYKQFYGE